MQKSTNEQSRSKKSGKKTTFNVFIRAVNQFKTVQTTFVLDLLSCLKCSFSSDTEDDTVKNWMAGKNQSFRKKFGGLPVSKNEFDACFNYLTDAIGNKFKKVQDELKDTAVTYPLIDFETDDKNVFVKSLVYQFIEIVNLSLDDTVEPRINSQNESKNKAPIDEAPIDRMIHVFEQAVADSNLVHILCNLSNYIGNQAFFAGDAGNFVNIVRKKIASAFVNLQNEVKFRQICEFTDTLVSYVSCLEMLTHTLDPTSESNSEDTGISDHFSLYTPLPRYYYSVFEVNSEGNSSGIEDILETKFKVEIDWEAYRRLWCRERNYSVIYKRISSDRSQLQIAQNAEEVKLTLYFLEQTFVSHEKLCKLFFEITGGKTLMMY